MLVETMRPRHRRPHARSAAAQMAFTNLAHDTRLEHQERADSAARLSAAPNAQCAELHQPERRMWPPTPPF